MAVIPREHRRELPEVHVAGLCARRHGAGVRVLLVRRAPWRELSPGLWEGCGGQLAYGESLTDGVRRHFREELGIAVEVDLDRHVLYEIPRVGSVIPGVRFLCRQLGQETPRGEVRWVTPDELAALPAATLVPGLQRDAARLLTPPAPSPAG